MTTNRVLINVDLDPIGGRPMLMFLVSKPTPNGRFSPAAEIKQHIGARQNWSGFGGAAVTALTEPSWSA